MGAAFTSFGFGVLSNVVVYISLLLLIGVSVLFGLYFKKKQLKDHIINYASSILAIVVLSMSLGVLLFALSSNMLLKDLVDLMLLLVVVICSLIGFIFQVINTIKFYLLNT